MASMVLVQSKDPEFLLIFSHILEVDGFETEIASGVDETMERALTHRPMAIVLDCKAGDRAAVTTCSALKKDPEMRKVPVVALMAAKAEKEHLALLKAGVDETFRRPFAPLQLLDYLRARRAATLSLADAGAENRSLHYSGIELNRATHRVKVSGHELELPPIEFKLLRHLMERPGTVFSRDELIEAAWPERGAADPRSVDVHVARLRKALKRVGAKDTIRTVRDAGYALADRLGPQGDLA
jgi:two-component system, OmpR family, phosphate regulon response regulator PhoB